MTERVPSVFHTTMHKSLQWLHEIEQQTGWHDQRAYRALRATLHVLRDRLTVDQAAHLGAQLPMLVRGFYYEGWHPAATPRRDLSSKEAFLDAIRREAGDPQMDAETAACITFSILTAHLGAEEVRKVVDHLPKPVARMFRSNGLGTHDAPEPPAAGGADFIAGAGGIQANPPR